MADVFEIASAATNEKIVFEEEIFREVVEGSLVGKLLVGGNEESPLDIDSSISMLESSPNAVIQQKTNLEGSQGGALQFSLIKNVNPQIVRGFNTLEGKEGKLTSYEDTLYLDLYRAAIKNHKLSEYRAAFNVSNTARASIKNTLIEFLDKKLIHAYVNNMPVEYGTATDNTDIFYTASGAFKRTATPATAAAAITSVDKLTVDLIQNLNTFADTGGDTTLSEPQRKIRPANIGGEKIRVIITHPDCIRDLKDDTEYGSYIKDARERGRENPFFTGALALIDGTMILPHPFIPLFTAADGTTYAKSIYCGAQSMLLGLGQRPNIVEKLFDYDEIVGLAWRTIMELKKPVFNSIDNGSYGLYLATGGVSSTAVV